MSRWNSPARMVLGTLRRRLLVNAIVEPAEAATRLPAGLRPHVTAAGTIVGCCLLDVRGLRPRGVPAGFGVSMRAAAHRISAEWEDGAGETVVGVYVPERRTDSRLAVALGGTWFPGVHRRARVEVRDDASGFSWSVQGEAFSIAVRVSGAGAPGADLALDAIAGTCVGANVGLSPDRHGVLEGARMEPDRREARAVAVEELASTFISSFATARPAPAYLMEDVAVVWTPAPAPDPRRATTRSAA